MTNTVLHLRGLAFVAAVATALTQLAADAQTTLSEGGECDSRGRIARSEARDRFGDPSFGLGLGLTLTLTLTLTRRPEDSLMQPASGRRARPSHSQRGRPSGWW